MANELPAPPAVASHPDSAEIARIWTLDEEQHVTLSSNIWDEPGMWGLMLVDLARHVAAAYEQRYGYSKEESLARIRECFDAEWDSSPE